MFSYVNKTFAMLRIVDWNLIFPALGMLASKACKVKAFKVNQIHIYQISVVSCTLMEIYFTLSNQCSNYIFNCWKIIHARLLENQSLQ